MASDFAGGLSRSEKYSLTKIHRVLCHESLILPRSSPWKDVVGRITDHFGEALGFRPGYRPDYERDATPEETLAMRGLREALGEEDAGARESARPNQSSEDKMRECMSTAYAIGSYLRRPDWPWKPRGLAMQIAHARYLLRELGVLYWRMTGEWADDYDDDELFKNAKFIHESRDEIDRLANGDAETAA
jgi:hypothetical protein